MHAHPDHGDAHVVLVDRIHHSTDRAADDRDDRDPRKPGDCTQHRFDDLHGLTFRGIGSIDNGNRYGWVGHAPTTYSSVIARSYVESRPRHLATAQQDLTVQAPSITGVCP